MVVGVWAGMLPIGGCVVAAGGFVGGGFVDAVVVEAFELALTQAGDAAVAVGDDVVDVAAGGGFVAAGGVLAVSVADLDDAAHRSGEAAFAGGFEAACRGVVDDPFDVGIGQVGDE